LPALGKQQKTFVQEAIGVFLYYAQAVDCTMLTALGSLATQQANPTETTLTQIHQFLDYALSHPNASVTYHASDMILAAHIDASYLSKTNACSHAGGHFFFSKNDHFPNNNGAVLTIVQINKAVMSLAAEAELGALYINAQEVILLRLLLVKMAIHNRPPPFKQTTPLPWVLSTTPSNQNVLWQWTCVSTGCAAELTKKDVVLTGMLVPPTWQTMSLSITPPFIIKQYDPSIFQLINHHYSIGNSWHHAFHAAQSCVPPTSAHLLAPHKLSTNTVYTVPLQGCAMYTYMSTYSDGHTEVQS
jgi:hypothetical protein